MIRVLRCENVLQYIRVDFDSRQSPVNRCTPNILEACRRSADDQQMIFYFLRINGAIDDVRRGDVKTTLIRWRANE